MKKGKVLFIDSVHPILKDSLENEGWQCDWFVDYSRSEIEAIIGEYDGIVIRSKFTIDKQILDISTNLKFIARSGAGLENIDLDYAAEKGVRVFNSPEGNRDAVGEQALGMLLSLFQKLKQGDAQVRQGKWHREGNRGIELKGKTVGIIGYGNMGSAFAQRLSGFECEVIAYDKYNPDFTNSFAKSVSLSELQQRADVISFHVPFAEDTHYYLNNDFIQNCSKPFYVINTARGKVVNTESLVEGLKSRTVLGACLDVLEYESASFEEVFAGELPEPMQYLVESDRVILSPHVAGWTVESYEKLSTFLFEKIKAEF